MPDVPDKRAWEQVNKALEKKQMDEALPPQPGAVMDSAQLDATKHQLSEVARVRKAQATVIAEQFIRALDQRHLEYLTSLGLRNLEVRQRALIEVGDQTTAMLRELETRDWPQHLIDKTIQSVVELHARFFEKIMAELGQQK